MHLLDAATLPHLRNADNTTRAPYDFQFQTRIGGILLSSSMYYWEKANLVASSKATIKQASSRSNQKKSTCANAEFLNPLEIITTNVQVNVYVHRSCHGSFI